MSVTAESGEDGSAGTNGKAGRGGKSGVKGIDCARVEPGYYVTPQLIRGNLQLRYSGK